MQHSRLLPAVPRNVFNVIVAVFLLSLVVLSFTAFHNGSLGGSLVRPLHYTNPGQQQAQPTTDRRCSAVPDPPNVAVAIKTGANLIYDKLPMQLLARLQCADDPLIFSDLAQTLGPHQVYDALADVAPDIKNGPDFDYYRQIQEYQNSGQDLRALRDARPPAWKLDRYKFIHMLKKTWEIRPGHDWYIFLEGDTYLLWTNVMMWLQQLDPNTPQYLGQQSYFKSEPFAHGGSGIVISQAAMSQVLDNDPDIASRYDELAQKETYGDFVLMKALQEKGIDLTPYKPMLQGERPNAVRFGPGRHSGERSWCQPLLSLHHVTPSDVDALWQYEQQRQDPTQPISYADMYQHFVAPSLPRDSDDREDWHNFSDDAHIKPPDEKAERPIPEDEMTPVQAEAYQSYDKCAAACAEYHRCMQYSYDFLAQRCSYSFSYRLGEKRPPTSDGRRHKSGWILTRINRDIEENGCTSLEWEGFHA
jgi:hypothetical protein